MPKCTLTQEERRIENVLWHPLAEGILAVSTFKTLKVFDVNTQTAVYSKCMAIAKKPNIFTGH